MNMERMKRYLKFLPEGDKVTVSDIAVKLGYSTAETEELLLNLLEEQPNFGRFNPFTGIFTRGGSDISDDAIDELIRSFEQGGKLPTISDKPIHSNLMSSLHQIIEQTRGIDKEDVSVFLLGESQIDDIHRFVRMIDEDGVGFPSPDMYLALSVISQKLKRYSDAAILLAEAIKRDYSNSELWNQLGICLESMQLYDKAIMAYNLGIRNSQSRDQRAILYLQLGNLHRNRGAYEQAEIIYLKGITQFTDNPQLWYEFGNISVIREKYDMAIDAYKKAIDLKPEEPEFWHRLGLLYYSRKRYLEATQAFKVVLNFKPEKAEQLQPLLTN